jgi:proton-translocating NADH-quinone oxidoreductase chain L
MYRRRRRRPLIGGRSARIGGKRRGRSGSVRRTTGRVLRTRRRSRGGRYEVGRNGNVVKRERGVWMESSRYRVKWGLRYDSLTVVMCVVVTRVSSMVHRYSIEYMGGDAHQTRFMSYLSRFTFGMLRLVTADNRVQRFVGWEGVGVCSYLLINFWYTRIQANKAAIKAMLVNRVADIGLALGRRRRYEKRGSREYGRVCSAGQRREEKDRERVGRRRRVGAAGKSAQRGLHTWLPDAMEGPTPVSALIHAATMVTAGIFLMGRCSPLREYAPNRRKVVTRRGGMTAFYAGTIGLVQNDRKRVIAYSTCSQLGYMRRGCGLSAYDVAVFHLANHARFKALLFLSAGSVIHAVGDEQDMRRMGGRARRRPRTYGMMRRGSVALMGFPFRTGYYSKDVRLEVAYGSYGWTGHVGHWLGTSGARCTGFYSMRLRHRTFRGEPNGHRKVYEGGHDAPLRMARPRRRLGVGSVIGGWRRKDRRIGVGTPFWGQALYTHADGRVMLEAEFRPSYVKRGPVRVGRLGGSRGRGRYERKGKEVYGMKRQRKERYGYRNKKWYFDKVYTERVSVNVRDIGYKRRYKGVDRGVIERRGPGGVSKERYRKGKGVVERQTGEVYHYTGWMVYGILRRRVGRRVRV